MLYLILVMSLAKNTGLTFSWHMPTILHGLIPGNLVKLPNFNEGYTIEKQKEVYGQMDVLCWTVVRSRHFSYSYNVNLLAASKPLDYFIRAKNTDKICVFHFKRISMLVRFWNFSYSSYKTDVSLCCTSKLKHVKCQSVDLI